MCKSWTLALRPVLDYLRGAVTSACLSWDWWWWTPKLNPVHFHYIHNFLKTWKINWEWLRPHLNLLKRLSRHFSENLWEEFAKKQTVCLEMLCTGHDCFPKTPQFSKENAGDFLSEAPGSMCGQRHPHKMKLHNPISAHAHHLKFIVISLKQ